MTLNVKMFSDYPECQIARAYKFFHSARETNVTDFWIISGVDKVRQNKFCDCLWNRNLILLKSKLKDLTLNVQLFPDYPECQIAQAYKFFHSVRETNVTDFGIISGVDKVRQNKFCDCLWNRHLILLKSELKDLRLNVQLFPNYPECQIAQAFKLFIERERQM